MLVMKVRPSSSEKRFRALMGEAEFIESPREVSFIVMEHRLATMTNPCVGVRVSFWVVFRKYLQCENHVRY